MTAVRQRANHAHQPDGFRRIVASIRGLTFSLGAAERSDGRQSPSRTALRGGSHAPSVRGGRSRVARARCRGVDFAPAQKPCRVTCRCEVLKRMKVLTGTRDLPNAPLAQLAEQLTLNQWVSGSSPEGCTRKKASDLRKRRSEALFLARNFYLKICQRDPFGDPPGARLPRTAADQG